MKKKTYGNVLKAGRLIQKKGYDKQTALEIAVKLFDNLIDNRCPLPVEFLIDKLRNADE